MSGIGRGRGWLNINKNINNKPGIQSPVENTLNTDFNPTISPAAPAKINPKYANVIAKISLYDENDDGILLNQKLKYIVEEFTKDCPTANDVEEAYIDIHKTCLCDEEFAAKAIGVASAASFNSVTIHGIKIRNLFIAQFQQDFETSKQTQKTNERAFRVIVKMLGDFYHKARFFDGQPIKFLSSPMVKYLEMLLDSTNEVDLQLFTVQLYMNGNSIKEELPSKLSDLLIQVRNVLAYKEGLSANSKLWLMMALDIASNRYNYLPTELHQFYLLHLGDIAMARIKKLTTELSIQTSYQNSTLDSIQSNVNVLQQVSSASEGWDSPSSTSLDSDKPASGSDLSHTKYPTKPRNFKTPDAGFNNIGTWEQPKSEKTPRPILGAGVRLKQTENKPTTDEANWRERKFEGEWKENAPGWDNKKKGSGSGSGWTGAATKPRKNIVSKGWEHDDRFENEYN